MTDTEYAKAIQTKATVANLENERGTDNLATGTNWPGLHC